MLRLKHAFTLLALTPALHNQHQHGPLQANYQLVLPTMQDYLQHVGAAASLAGYMIGSADVATIPGTVGECQCCRVGSVLPGPVKPP